MNPRRRNATRFTAWPLWPLGNPTELNIIRWSDLEYETMVKVKKVLKTYGGKSVLKELDFEVEEGERVYILAPNGFGKTTFLKVLANIEPFQKGK